MRRIAAILAALALPLVLLAPAQAAVPTLTYSAHVAGIGWLPEVTSPASAGTTGQARRMEALTIGTGIGLSYRAHVAGLGWLPWVGAPWVAGTTGQARQMEAFQVVLDPGLAVTWQVTYRAHVAGLGWLPWVSDGATAGTTGQARRMEAAQIMLVPRVTSTTTTTAPATSDPTRLTITADTGIDDPAGSAVLSGMGRETGAAAWIVGDLAYAPSRETEYCRYVQDRIPGGAQLTPGNHEAGPNPDGLFAAYAACLPDRWSVVGDYRTGHWYADRGPYRLISIAPTIALPTGTLTYSRGTPEREQLKDWIDAAQAAGRWVIVAMHHPCLTVGAHGCSSDPTITDMLIGKRVPLVVAGHDHNYSRSHQLTGTAAAPVVVDRDGTFAAGAGSVLVTVGAGGHNARTVASPLPAWAATASGTNSPGGIAFGHLEITATPTALTARYVADAGNTAYSDSFVVAR